MSKLHATRRPERSAIARRSFGGLRSPHYSDVDLSLHKDFPITERFRLQFRSDFVNAFNHVQYNAPKWVWGTYGPDHKCSTPKEHTVGVETLLLKSENV